MRRITQAMPADHAAALFDARNAGASEGDLVRIVAAGLQDAYFQDGGTRATDLAVDLTDIDYLDIDYR